MNTIILLFVVGILLMGFEVFVPGAILGIIGGVVLLGGVVMAFVDFGPAGGSAALGTALLLVGLMLYVELAILPKTRLGRRLFLQSSVTGTSQPAVAEASLVVGRPAEAVTTLAPTGYVMVDGKRYEAYSQSGLIDRGATLRVVGLDNFRLIVTKP